MTIHEYMRTIHNTPYICTIIERGCVKTESLDDQPCGAIRNFGKLGFGP